MSPLMVDFIMSLDGYGAAEGWPGYWGMEGPEYLAWIGGDETEEHTALMGATTYRLMSGFAAQMPDDPGLTGLTALRKRVFSSTLEGPLSWANSKLVQGDAVAAVREMKERDSIPLRTIGSISLCRSLLTAGLVDRFRVVVFPVITGATGQDRIFDGYPDVAQVQDLLGHGDPPASPAPGGPSRTVGTYSSSWSRPSNVRFSTRSRTTSG